jgi:hypothetical protein
MVELGNFLQKNDIDCEIKLYDFSEQQIIDGALHRPYPAGEYKKAEKTNVILRENQDVDYICMFDCDTFFVEQDYKKYLDILKNISRNEVHTFDLAKVDQSTTTSYFSDPQFNIFDADCWFAYAGSKAHGPFGNGTQGALGGVYICDFNLIKAGGFFNENIVRWGGEDGDMLDRIWQSKIPYKQIPHRDFFPFHLPHPPVL